MGSYYYIKIFIIFLLINFVQSDFCEIIKNSWWKNRRNYRAFNKVSYAAESRDYCTQFDGEVEKCVKAPLNTEGGAFMGCTIEGHGSLSCVPSPCAFLNNGFCTPELTGGLCQWFESIPDPDRPNRSKRARGCYRNPCHIAGQPYNNEYYCTSDPHFQQRLDLYRPKVTCGWCHHDKIGCQNVDTNPKTGCDSMESRFVNALGRENAAAGRKLGSIMYLPLSSDPNSPYRKNTVCWDRTKTFEYTNAKRRIECMYGIHPNCHPDLGYKWKYPIKDLTRSQRSLEATEDSLDVKWTLDFHGYEVDNTYERIVGVAD